MPLVDFGLLGEGTVIGLGQVELSDGLGVDRVLLALVEIGGQVDITSSLVELVSTAAVAIGRVDISDEV